MECDRFVIRGNIDLVEGGIIVDISRAHVQPIKTAAQKRNQPRFGEHDAAAGPLCHRSNKPRQPQLLSDATFRSIRSNQNASASEIATIPFRNRTLLLQCGRAVAKLPRSLVKLENEAICNSNCAWCPHHVGFRQLRLFPGWT